MKQVTRDVDPGNAQDLLERVPRACLAFASENGPQIHPVGLIRHEGRYLVSIPDEAELQPASGQEVVLLVDEGIYYFDLRAMYIRGQTKPAVVPPSAPPGRVWLEVVPLKTVAWDYGKLREVRNEP
ncbi:MAG: hypothetical protein ACM3PY_06245 [Omnitrophica WOR_2 bacterium]